MSSRNMMNSNQPTNQLQPYSSTNSGAVNTNQCNRRHNCRPPVVKRSHPANVLNGILDSWSVTYDAELLCPICFEMLSQSQVTKCGHTFCYACIHRHIELHSRCAKCNLSLSKGDISPNFVLNDIINSRKTKAIKLELETQRASPVKTFSAFEKDNNGGMLESFVSGINKFTLTDIDVIMSVLRRKKETLTIESKQLQMSLTVDFLRELQRIRLAEKAILGRELELINHDVTYISSGISVPEEASGSVNAEDQSSIPSMKRRISVHFEELSHIYLDSRNARLFDPQLNNNDAGVSSGSVLYESLDTFSDTLSRMSRYHMLKPLATLSYRTDLLSSSCIVSSIEFDKDSEVFAIAGVTRKIKLFEYATVIGSLTDVHCPISELICKAKVSSLAWSNYYKNKLASSDYDGNVALWDVGTLSKTRVFNEHEKRVWSVDWSKGDPRLLASGSDDSTVKLWSANSEKSVSVLNAKANVCCVKFCPQNPFNIVFGTADCSVHYYDFRQTREPLRVLQEHRKSVSYVEFASENELISASTESQLKLWSLDEMTVVRSYKGHTNEKHFVGLATDGDYIACGSENNSLYVYYKGFPKPLFSFQFDKHQSMLERPQSDDSSTDFVSAVTWKRNSPVVIAANSLGFIKILELG